MSDPSATTTITWLSVLAPTATFILGFVSAVFAEPFRQWWFRPKIELTFQNNSDHVALTPYIDSHWEYEAYYIRVGVSNKSRQLARKCRAYLVNVEEKDKEKSIFTKSIYADSIQLAWSCKESGVELEAIDIPHGVKQYIDLVATIDSNNMYKPQIKPTPLRYKELFSNVQKDLRFTIQVSGDGLDPVIIKVVFCWKGNWDDFDVYHEK